MTQLCQFWPNVSCHNDLGVQLAAIESEDKTRQEGSGVYTVVLNTCFLTISSEFYDMLATITREIKSDWNWTNHNIIVRRKQDWSLFPKKCQSNFAERTLAYTQCWFDVVELPRRWPSIEAALGQCLVFAGIYAVSWFSVLNMFPRVITPQT